MTIKEFFGDWWKCIDENALLRIFDAMPTLYQNKVIYPAYKDIFRAFSLCKYNNVSVIILGQDPYPDGKATGLAFANSKDTKVLSPSLEIIKNCLEDLHMSENFSTFAPDLEKWAKQGVLLLNTALTVEANKVGSHTMLWRPFISSFLKNLGEWNPGLVYVLMGEQAKTFKPYIGKFNDIIEVKHPAYYARTNTKMPDFFSEIDKLTISKNNFKIDWL